MTTITKRTNQHFRKRTYLLLGALGLIVFFSVPPLAQAAPLCEAYSATQSSAKAAFEKKCKVKFTPSNGHYCNKTSAGKYKCSNAGEKTSSSSTPATKPDVAPQAMASSSSSSCKTIWAPSEVSLANAGWAYGSWTNGKGRVSYDPSTESVKINQRANAPKQLSDYRGGATGTGNVVRMSVQVYLSPNFKGQAGSRFAIGFRGGPTTKSAAGAGKSGSEQDGWSLRIGYNANVQPMLYSYHLNRNSNYGSGPRAPKGLPKGQWMTIVTEAKLNTPGKPDGAAFLKVYDGAGKLYTEISAKDLLWRKDSSWKHIGVYLTDKIEGAPKSTQYILYRNYSLSVGQGTKC